MQDAMSHSSISRSVISGLPVFRVEGRLDRTAASLLEAAVRGAMEQGHRAVALDMGPTERLDAAAVPLLVAMNEHLRATRRELRILDASPAVCHVLSARGLDFLLPAYPAAC